MDGITWGHVLVVAGVLDALAALAFFVGWWRVRDYGYGTPLYARGRTAKRSAAYAIVSAALLGAIGWLTPLWQTAIL